MVIYLMELLEGMKMINLSERFNKLIDSLKEKNADETSLFEAIHFQRPYIFIAITWPTLQRCMYIDITDEEWNAEQLKSFPRWRGLDIRKEYFTSIGRLKNKTMLVITQDVENSEEIFEQVLQNLLEHIVVEAELPLYTLIYEVLDRWHNFFKRKFSKRLTIEEEMGLFGELYYIDKWLDIFPNSPPLIINDWKGPLKNRIDIVKKAQGIEIKTISPKIRDEIKISNEKQLETNAVINDLTLYILKMEVSDSVGQTLQELVDRVIGKIQSRAPSLVVKFKDLLLSIGVVDNEYIDNYFYVHEELAYKVVGEFPRIISNQLPIGITNVSYSIDLSHCKKYEVEVEEAFIC